MNDLDTIAAIATPSGDGGIGMKVRVMIMKIIVIIMQTRRRIVSNMTKIITIRLQTKGRRKWITMEIKENLK